MLTPRSRLYLRLFLLIFWGVLFYLVFSVFFGRDAMPFSVLQRDVNKVVPSQSSANPSTTFSIIKNRKIFRPPWPTYRKTVYRDWAHREVNKILEDKHGLRLAPLDRKMRLPIIYEAPNASILEVYRTAFPKSQPDYIEGIYWPWDGNIYIGSEQKVRAEYVIAHEFTHYIFDRYGQGLSIGAGEEEDIAMQLQEIFRKRFLSP